MNKWSLKQDKDLGLQTATHNLSLGSHIPPGKLAPHLPVNQLVTFFLLSHQLYKSSEQRTHSVSWLGMLLMLLALEPLTRPLATWPQAAQGLANLVFSHSYFCLPALPWNFAFHPPPNPRTLPSPILFHGNRSLINWLHTKRFTDL